MSRSWVTSGPRPAPASGGAPTTGLPTRHHRDQRADRQRGRLPQPAVRDGAGRHRRAPPAHSSLPTTDERQGRAVQPDPAGGVGLSAAVPLQRRPRPCLAALGPSVQPSPSPYRPRRPATHQPRQQPPWLLHLDETEGVAVQDVWTDIAPINSQAKERLGYPTQKPLKLTERIIQASSHEGDLVLDPFCGCGTTIDSAVRLKRRWIGIDITYLAIDL